jgi:hypothetical protein
MPFEVVAWTPGNNCFENTDDINVSLSFSHTPDEVMIERSFYITEDGIKLNGKIILDDKHLYFTPFSPFEKNKDYIINLETEACNEHGLNLEKKFEGYFTTKPHGEYPVIVSVKPANEERLLEKRQHIYIDFSESAAINSCVNYILFSPSMSGSWRLENDNKTAVFTPKEAWKSNETYKMTITNEFQSMTGRHLRNNLVHRFHTNTDTTAPYLLNVSAITENDDVAFELTEYDITTEGASGIVAENVLWENGYRMKFNFSEPIDIARFKSITVIEPSPKFKIDTPPPYSDSIIISFIENPVWGSRFTMTAGAGNRDAAGNESRDVKVFKIFANGVHSKPPSFAGFTLFKEETSAPDSVKKIGSYTADKLFRTFEINSNDFPYDQTVSVYIELYFNTADNARINLFSIMDLFRVESTNTALNFTPLVSIGEDFICVDDTPDFNGLCRIEIKGLLKNTARGGIVSFYISPGLMDSYSNVNQEAMSIQLLK